MAEDILIRLAPEYDYEVSVEEAAAALLTSAEDQRHESWRDVTLVYTPATKQWHATTPGRHFMSRSSVDVTEWAKAVLRGEGRARWYRDFRDRKWKAVTACRAVMTEREFHAWVEDVRQYLVEGSLCTT